MYVALNYTHELQNCRGTKQTYSGTRNRIDTTFQAGIPYLKGRHIQCYSCSRISLLCFLPVLQVSVSVLQVPVRSICTMSYSFTHLISVSLHRIIFKLYSQHYFWILSFSYFWPQALNNNRRDLRLSAIKKLLLYSNVKFLSMISWL